MIAKSETNVWTGWLVGLKDLNNLRLLLCLYNEVIANLFVTVKIISCFIPFKWAVTTYLPKTEGHCNVQRSRLCHLTILIVIVFTRRQHKVTCLHNTYQLQTKFSGRGISSSCSVIITAHRDNGVW